MTLQTIPLSQAPPQCYAAHACWWVCHLLGCVLLFDNGPSRARLQGKCELEPWISTTAAAGRSGNMAWEKQEQALFCAAAPVVTMWGLGVRDMHTEHRTGTLTRSPLCPRLPWKDEQTHNLSLSFIFKKSFCFQTHSSMWLSIPLISRRCLWSCDHPCPDTVSPSESALLKAKPWLLRLPLHPLSLWPHLVMYWSWFIFHLMSISHVSLLLFILLLFDHSCFSSWKGTDPKTHLPEMPSEAETGLYFSEPTPSSLQDSLGVFPTCLPPMALGAGDFWSKAHLSPFSPPPARAEPLKATHCLYSPQKLWSWLPGIAKIQAKTSSKHSLLCYVCMWWHLLLSRSLSFQWSSINLFVFCSLLLASYLRALSGNGYPYSHTFVHTFL